MTLLRLGSVTHAFNANQRFVPVPFTAHGTTLQATLPAQPGACVPGHYMLFVLTAAGVPSVARIVRIADPHLTPPPRPSPLGSPHPPPWPTYPPDGTRVTVGLTAQCPYGLAACWGGAYEALATFPAWPPSHPTPTPPTPPPRCTCGTTACPTSTPGPPRLARSANGSYTFRGIELTLDGTIEQRNSDLVLVGRHPNIHLRPLTPGSELAWDLATRQPRPATADERDAHHRAAHRVGAAVRVTGPATKVGGQWSLAVRIIDDT